jgi:hypothetical protein
MSSYPCFVEEERGGISVIKGRTSAGGALLVLKRPVPFIQPA